MATRTFALSGLLALALILSEALVELRHAWIHTSCWSSTAAVYGVSLCGRSRPGRGRDRSWRGRRCRRPGRAGAASGQTTRERTGGQVSHRVGDQCHQHEDQPEDEQLQRHVAAPLSTNWGSTAVKKTAALGLAAPTANPSRTVRQCPLAACCESASRKSNRASSRRSPSCSAASASRRSPRGSTEPTATGRSSSCSTELLLQGRQVTLRLWSTHPHRPRDLCTSDGPGQVPFIAGRPVRIGGALRGRGRRRPRRHSAEALRGTSSRPGA